MTRAGRSWNALDAACVVGALGAVLFLVAGRTGALRPPIARPVVTVVAPQENGRAVARVDHAAWQHAFARAGLPTPPDLSGLDPVPVQKVAEAAALWDASRDVASLLRLGQTYAGAGQMEAAYTVFAAATSYAPNEPVPPYFLGLSAQRLERNAEALAALEKARRLEPGYTWTALRLGLLQLERGDAGAAAPLFEELRQREPSCPWGRIGLGRAALQRDDFPGAVAVLAEAKRQAPRDYFVRLYLTRALAGAGDHAAARREGDFLRRVAPYDPLRQYDPREEEIQEVAQSHRHLERIYVEAQGRGQHAEALLALRSALARRGDDPMLHLSAASILRELGRKDEAAAEVETAARLSPSSGAVARARAELAFQASDLSTARRHLVDAQRLDPSDALAFDLDGRALSGLGKPEEAAAAFRRALELDPKLESARLALAITELQLGRKESARTIALEILELNPGHPQARQIVAAVSGGAPGR